MKDFLYRIIAAMVDDPEKVKIQEEEQEGLTVYTIIVPEEEVGRIIGKEGRVISSIRCLARLKAVKRNQRILVKISSQMENGLSRPTEGSSSSKGTSA